MSHDKPTDGYCNAQTSDGGYCARKVANEDDRCHYHGGATPTADENPAVGNGDQEGNDNAVTHGAFREFFAKSLTNEEAQAVRQAEQLLEDTNDAQQVGRTAASLCLIQYNRTGDERFMRRFESICDTFEIAPEDVQKHEHSGELEHSGGFEVNISRHRVTEDDLEDQADE